MFKHDSAGDRARKYAKARVTCQAPRGWEPWSEWEDCMVAGLVECGRNQTVAQLAARLKRTENAILCRIEKKYGADMRARFTPSPVVNVDFAQVEARVLNAMLYGTSHPEAYKEATMYYEPSDAKVHWDAIADIRRAKNNPFFDPARFAYRVTQREFDAIARHMIRNGWAPRYVGWPKTIAILGVEVLPVMAEIAPVIKDYGVSG